MISALRLTIASGGTGTAQWGRVTYAVTDWRKDAGAYKCVITPDGFSPSILRIEPAAGIMWCDAVAFRLLDWRVNGREATARTDDGGAGR